MSLKKCEKCGELIYFNTQYDICPTCQRTTREKKRKDKLKRLRNATQQNNLKKYKARPLTKDTMWLVWLWHKKEFMSFEDIARLLSRPVDQVKLIYLEGVKKWDKN